MSDNSNLLRSKKVKNDEYYTLMPDIQTELAHYTTQFKDKVVFCNCDNPKESNFYKYFKQNFKTLHLKKLIAVYYNRTRKSYVTIYNGKTETKRQLTGHGSFDSPESICYLKQSDIIVTNPPFSLFRDFITLLMTYKKKFLILGPFGALAYECIFPYMKARKITFGYDNDTKHFKTPDGDKTVKVAWYTNLKVRHNWKDLDLTATYTKKNYPSCDNCNAINVDAVADIPKNYKKPMAVPITFMMNLNPNKYTLTDKTSCHLGKKQTYARLIVKRK